jgi:hypothetical protein
MSAFSKHFENSKNSEKVQRSSDFKIEFTYPLPGTRTEHHSGSSAAVAAVELEEPQ